MIWYVMLVLALVTWGTAGFMFGRAYERRHFNKWAKVEMKWALHTVLKKMYEDGIVPKGSWRIEDD